MKTHDVFCFRKRQAFVAAEPRSAVDKVLVQNEIRRNGMAVYDVTDADMPNEDLVGINQDWSRRFSNVRVNDGRSDVVPITSSSSGPPSIANQSRRLFALFLGGK